ncbi:rho GTPase-activating protein 20-like [Perognathus longimembris pacificus]|uniref:rho GTPase-activating protein 20-like n=1 Tax=Perognathus longimembris pacificus TaxID=214514 RepID=UPI0020197005|nr:rho GTPase-activating protein 20-like [Perognathus longimembris pacificus]
MITFISQEVLLTEGIFRESGSAKAYRALKERLICGAPVYLHEESVLVMASVLKDFLRNVEGSVFSFPQYETWLGIMNKDNEEEKMTAARSLLEMLPRANQMRLKHLFAMLSQIHQNSYLNLRTSYNLAVCTASSLMAPPPDASPGFDIELMRKEGEISEIFYIISIDNGGQMRPQVLGRLPCHRVGAQKYGAGFAAS